MDVHSESCGGSATMRCDLLRRKNAIMTSTRTKPPTIAPEMAPAIAPLFFEWLPVGGAVLFKKTWLSL